MPIEPEIADNALAKPLSYPCFAIAGIKIDPIAATVAVPEPEIAAKKT